MIQIKQYGLRIYSDDLIIPAQYSNHIPVSFIKQAGYEEYAVLGAYSYRDGCRLVSGALEYVNNQFILPANPFLNEGTLTIGIKLVGKNDSPSLGSVDFYVRKGVNPNVELPEEKTWSEFVNNLVSQLIDNIYGTEIQNLIDEAKKQQSAVTQQQKTLDNLIKTTSEQQTYIQKLFNDTETLQTKVNDLVRELNQKIISGDFIPNISIGNTITVEPEQSAKVTMTGTKENPVFSFEIPRGEKGASGALIKETIPIGYKYLFSKYNTVNSGKVYFAGEEFILNNSISSQYQEEFLSFANRYNCIYVVAWRDTSTSCHLTSIFLTYDEKFIVKKDISHISVEKLDDMLAELKNYEDKGEIPLEWF